MDNISCQKWLNFNLKGHLDLRSISQVQMFYYVKCKKKSYSATSGSNNHSLSVYWLRTILLPSPTSVTAVII